MSERDSICAHEEKPVVEFRDVPGFPGYRADSEGNVWSCRKSSGGEAGLWKKMQPTIKRKGYLQVCLRRNKRNVTRRVHHIILESFGFGRPPGAVCCHAPDRNPQNNKLENLRWGSHFDNAADKTQMGTTAKGERQGSSKLTEDQVRNLRHDRIAHKATYKSLGEKYGVDMTLAWAIVNRKIWRHVE